MLDDRKLSVLRAIVEDYVMTEEPVGSKALVDRHRLGVSSATVRNDMATLEEEGYIQQPHTSAGRIPTDKGYRLFVDRLAKVKPFSAAERRAIATFLDGAVDLDDTIQRTVRLLSQLTRQVAVVQYPSLSRSTFRHVELVYLNDTRLLLVLITNNGRVEQRVIEVEEAYDAEVIGELRARLNGALVGERLSKADQVLSELHEAFQVQDRPLVERIRTTIVESMIERPDDRIAVGGTANLIHFGHEFDRSLLPVLDALEEQVVLLRLLGEAASPSRIRVSIGQENPYAELSSASVVSSGYGPGDEAVGTLAVVGPTRMDYPGTIGAVRAVARYVSQILDEDR
ncbi:MAG TPA: heat-inducible transcriptional repressor HrcA [Actinopolymorphaceae bacterium]